MIRDATPEDGGAIVPIYNPYVRETAITFEYDEVSCEDMGARIARVQEQGFPWLVAVEADAVVGFAYAAPYRPRAAYIHTVETTVYLAHGAEGRGLGRALYGALLERLEASQAHSAIALIALPNDASIALHRRLGFRDVGVIEDAGWKLGRWIDVAYLQRTLS